MQELCSQLDRSRASNQAELAVLRLRMDRENEDYLQSHQSEAELLKQIEVLEGRNTEIEVDSTKMAEKNLKRGREIGEMRDMIRQIEEENKEIQRQNEEAADKNQGLKEKIAKLSQKEAQILVEIEGQEFINHMIGETPYMVLAIKS